MKKGAFIVLLALLSSIGVYAIGGKKSNKAKKKAKIECCEKAKCIRVEKPNCCAGQITCCSKIN
jgi:hypothetical protein